MESKITLNKAQLQIIAVIAMIVDHTAWAFVEFWSPLGQIMHLIGRLTIPVMCFFIAEGFKKTHDLYKYIGRIATFAIVSIVPFYIFFNEEYGYRQNIIFDHLISVLILTVLEHRAMKKWMKIPLVAILFLISATLGGWPFTPALFTLSFYYGKTFKDKAKWFILTNVATCGAVALITVLNPVLHLVGSDWKWYDRIYLLGFMLALPLIARYNGEKGKNPFGRYFFYGIYPIHLLILSFIKYVTGPDVSAYEIYLGVHVISLVIICAMAISVLQARPSRMQSAVSMFLVLESVYIIGFITEILATSVETLYMACIVEYFGEMLMLVAFLRFASECGRMRIPLFVYIAHILAALGIVYSIAISPRTGFFYKDIILTVYNGHTKAQYVHSTGYYLSVIFIITIVTEMFFIMVNSLIKGSRLEKRRVAMLFVTVMFIWIPYAITLTGITGGYEVPVTGVVGAAIFLTLCFYKYGSLDSVAIVSESALAKAGEGVIILDDRLRVSFSNAIAKKIVNKNSDENIYAGRNTFISDILNKKVTEVDYIGKIYEVRVEELKHSSYIQGYTIWFLDATRHREMLDEAENMANHDPLTGLYNRRQFEKLVSEEIERGIPGSLIISDMDNFKAVNDTFGHRRGDAVLKDLADILMEYPESELYPCRIGGDEFMIYLMGVTDKVKIEEFIKNVMDEFGKKFRGDKVKCTLSAGVAINGGAGNLSDFGTLYKTADKKLYKAKAEGKNKYII